MNNYEMNKRIDALRHIRIEQDEESETLGLLKTRYQKFFIEEFVILIETYKLTRSFLERKIGLKHNITGNWGKNLHKTKEELRKEEEIKKEQRKNRMENTLTDNQREKLSELIDIVAKEKENSLKRGNKTTYSTQLIKDIVSLREDLQCSQLWLAETLGVGSPTISKWIRKYKTDKTVIGQIHGKTVRYDIATKAMIVKKHIENGVKISSLADEYQVSQGAVSQWITRYSDIYEEYIDMPEGVMIIGKEVKRVYGLENIKKIMDKLREDEEAIKKMLMIMKTMGESTAEEENILTEIEEKLEAMEKGKEAMERNRK